MSVGYEMRRVDAIINAVLYEGYMLYPYRPSSVKNQQRWTFGGVYPQAYSIAHNGAEPWTMQTQCLVQGGVRANLSVTVGFLHLVERQVGELYEPLRKWPAPGEPRYRKVAMLEIGDRSFYTWQEAMSRQVVVARSSIGELLASTRVTPFSFHEPTALEPLTGPGGDVVGVLARTQQPVMGEVELRADAVAEEGFRLTVRIANTTPMESVDGIDRNAMSLRALVSCHTILNVRDGELVSSLDPPGALAAAVADCRNFGTWPVLVGEEGSRDTMLSSPIILYDYPQIAPESPGDLFDATEIDEILTLRILAMTDEEKREMAAVDERARALLERTEKLTPEQLQKLHGTLRGLRPVSAVGNAAQAPWDELDNKPRLAYLRVHGVELRVGDPVRLRPRRNGDILDLALIGKLATIESIERDFEDRVHVAVTVDDDPGQDLGLARMPGHRFFFSPEEVEPVAKEERSR